MTSPYTPPSVTILIEAPAKRTAHALLAIGSALIALFGIWVGTYVMLRSTVVPLELNVVVRSSAVIVFSALLAGLMLLPLRKLKWYWAIVVGPALALLIVIPTVFVAIYVLGWL